ncbi:MAG: bacillithiol biosynthesis BshC [Gemmatimonadales bacterium]|nr:bacillithiol biosynthesis BshC [Gemmatimonadales bacterium]
MPGLLQDVSEVVHLEKIGNSLEQGVCDVVVTGQQPGFLGGPLYTLYKIATTIALARRRTAEGRPTVPVFWSADDDDDLPEALAPCYWQPGEVDLRRAGAAGPKAGKGSRSLPVGELPVSFLGAEVAHWLSMLVDSPSRETKGDNLAADLAGIWELAIAQKWNWSQLQARAITRVFSGCGLVIVSGNDPHLHEVAEPIYRKILAGQEGLSALVRKQGQDLVQGGWHAQIGPRSLAKPLFWMKDGRRIHLRPEDSEVEAGSIRPGVLFRSLVQDWLLRPSAVVVGPGELAYLNQLNPLYAALNVQRCPLVPRLFGWVGPKGIDTGLLAWRNGKNEVSKERLAELADKAAEEAGAYLQRILCDSLGLDEDRAGELASNRARRYRKGVLAMLSSEAGRKAADERPAEPVWVFPDGQRQERRLASFCAAAVWGDEWVSALLDAAEAHLDCGLRGAWSEFLIEV